MRSLLLCAGVFGVSVAGCLNVDLPDDAVFFCDVAADCPGGTTCNVDVGRCLKDDVERDAPTLTVTPTTQQLRPPATLTITVSSDEEVAVVGAVATDVDGGAHVFAAPGLDRAGSRGPFVLTLATDEVPSGAVSVDVTALDLNGNEAVAHVDAVIDAVAPVVAGLTLTLPPNQTATNGTGTGFRAAIDDAVAVDGSIVDAAGAVVGVATVSSLSEGVVVGQLLLTAPRTTNATLTLRARDDLGNEGSADLAVAIDVDVPAVSVSVADSIAPVAALAVDADVVGGCVVAVAVDASDSGACAVDACVPVFPLQTSVGLVGLPVGAAAACAVVVDGAGNRGSARAEFAVLAATDEVSLDVAVVALSRGQQPGFARPGQPLRISGSCGTASTVDVSLNGAPSTAVACTAGRFDDGVVSAVVGSGGVFVVDATGHFDDAEDSSAHVEVVVDGDAPVLTLNADTTLRRTDPAVRVGVVTDATQLAVRATPGLCNAFVADVIADVEGAGVHAEDELFAARNSIVVNLALPAGAVGESRCVSVDAFDNAGNTTTSELPEYNLAREIGDPTLAITLPDGAPGLGRNTVFHLDARAEGAREARVEFAGLSCNLSFAPVTRSFRGGDVGALFGDFAVAPDAPGTDVVALLPPGATCGEGTLTISVVFVDDQGREKGASAAPLSTSMRGPLVFGGLGAVGEGPEVFRFGGLFAVPGVEVGTRLWFAPPPGTFRCEPAEAHCDESEPPPGPVLLPTRVIVDGPPQTANVNLPYAVVAEDTFGNRTVSHQSVLYQPSGALLTALPLLWTVRERVTQPNEPGSLGDNASSFDIDVENAPARANVEVHVVSSAASTSGGSRVVNDFGRVSSQAPGGLPRVESIDFKVVENFIPRTLESLPLSPTSTSSLTSVLGARGQAQLAFHVDLGAGDVLDADDLVATFDAFPGVAVFASSVVGGDAVFDVDLDDAVFAAADVEGPVIGSNPLAEGRLIARVQSTVRRRTTVPDRGGFPTAVETAVITQSTATRLYVDHTAPVVVPVAFFNIQTRPDGTFRLQGAGVARDFAGPRDVTRALPPAGFVEVGGVAVTGALTLFEDGLVTFDFAAAPEDAVFVVVDAAGNRATFSLANLTVNP